MIINLVEKVIVACFESLYSENVTLIRKRICIVSITRAQQSTPKKRSNTITPVPIKNKEP